MHTFTGKWITDDEFANLPPRNVFHKQLEPMELPCDEHRDRHVLFRKGFALNGAVKDATIYISADDYYKLYINGSFVAQGPAPSYHFQYNYNAIDVSSYLRDGENVIAVHTLYQGLINRVWQSGDNRHGLILDLVVEGKTVVSSDESFKTAIHTGYTEIGVCGYQTQFLERYDCAAPEENFAAPDFDDSAWQQAKTNRYADHTLVQQESKMLVFESIAPVEIVRKEGSVVCDFGANYVGHLWATAVGKKGDLITVRCAQELDADGQLRCKLRANCLYVEDWLLADGESSLDCYDYKTFRYAEFLIPEGVEIKEVSLSARHYPFELKTGLKPEYADDTDLQKIWQLCVNSQKYGVQEVIQDCMEREKGFYLGDGSYTSFTNMLLTHDDSMVRKLIDDAFATEFITDTLMTCMSCSFMQEVAEYPMIMVYLILWHYNYTGDKAYLQQNYEKVKRLLEAYRKRYEKNGLLRDLDKWCVVEWPKNFQHDYDVDILEGKVCHQAHVSINSYYIAAIRTANSMAKILGLPEYRDTAPLVSAFMDAFYDKERKLFKDGEFTDHISLVGNSFAYGLSICDDEAFKSSFLDYYDGYGISALSIFCSFPLMLGFVQNGEEEIVRQALLDEGAWKRMLREGATSTYEGWGRDTKKNASLFHLTLSYAAAFMADVDLKALFAGM